MQTDINTFVSPDVITLEIIILIVVLLCMMLYASIKLRSMLGMFGFMLMVITVIMAFTTDFSLIWFWIVTIIQTVILTMASMAYSRARMRAKS